MNWRPSTMRSASEPCSWACAAWPPARWSRCGRGGSPVGGASRSFPVNQRRQRRRPAERALPAHRPNSPSTASFGAGEEKFLLSQLDAVLEDAVHVHQRSDVPYGLFLSGGIDSAAIATLMARLNQRPVTAFTCGFDAPGAADERAQAERVARALGLDWRETTFDEADFWRILPQVAWALDDPTADYATLPT